jgi:hypothetical protein
MRALCAFKKLLTIKAVLIAFSLTVCTARQESGCIKIIIIGGFAGEAADGFLESAAGYDTAGIFAGTLIGGSLESTIGGHL